MAGLLLPELLLMVLSLAEDQTQFALLLCLQVLIVERTCLHQVLYQSLLLSHLELPASALTVQPLCLQAVKNTINKQSCVHGLN